MQAPAKSYQRQAQQQATTQGTPQPTSPPRDFVFRFTAVGAGPPVEVRVRRMLKMALRAYGLHAAFAGESHKPDCLSPDGSGSTMGAPGGKDAGEGESGV